MSEQENNDEVIVEDGSPTLKTSPKPSKKSIFKGTKVKRYVTSLVIFLILVVVATCVYLYIQKARLADSQQLAIDKLNHQISAQKSALDNNIQQTASVASNISTQMEQVNLQLQEVQNSNKLYKTDVQAMQRVLAEIKVQRPNDWVLSEVEYLVKLASKKIWLERDIPSAISLLFSADQRIAELSDPSLTKLRRALLDDMNVLESLPHLDSDGLILSLSTLERSADNLVVSGLVRHKADTKNEAKLSNDVSDWRSNLSKSWSNFIGSFIVINKRDSQIKALLSPEQRWYLKENILHDLAKAEFAVYREQQAIYDLSIRSALDALTQYYDLNDPATNHFYNALQSLSKRQISIDYPDQLKSAPVLERVIEQRVKKSLASARVNQE